MIKEDMMEQGIICGCTRTCRQCNLEFVTKETNLCRRESFRCEKCNKEYSWLNLIYNMFF